MPTQNHRGKGVGNWVGKLGEGVKNVAGAVKGGAKYVGIGTACVVAAAGNAGGAVESFADFVDGSVPVKTVGMPTGTNLMYRDPVTQEDSIVEAGSHWHQGYVNYLAGGGAEVLGYSENHNRDGGVPNRVGQMYGKYLETLGEGNRPDDVWTVHDGNGDGIGTVSGGTWYLGADDTFYDSDHILFGPGKVRGDVSQLPVFTSVGNLDYLPEMVVDEVPEPAALAFFRIGALGVSLRRRKRKFVES